MLQLVPNTMNDMDALDADATFSQLYDSPPAFVTQLMALTPCAADDPRSPARRPLPVYRAPLTHPLSDVEQYDALLLDHERYEDSITAIIRATSATETRPAPTPIRAMPRRDYFVAPPVSGDDHTFAS